MVVAYLKENRTLVGKRIMKKVKMILTLITLSLIIVIIGCGANVKTAPWSDDDIQRMEQEEVDCVPILRIEF